MMVNIVPADIQLSSAFIGYETGPTLSTYSWKYKILRIFLSF